MSSAQAVLSGQRVLIVEDRYLIASELEADIRRLGGVIVGPAKSIEAAQDLVRSGPVDLALLDVNLDGESVFPVAQALAAQGTPFIFVTGYDEWDWPSAWESRPRLTKPVNLRQLEALLAALSAGAKGEAGPVTP